MWERPLTVPPPPRVVPLPYPVALPARHALFRRAQIIEDVLALLDLLTVWELDTEWHEMRQLGLTILLEFAAQPNIEVGRPAPQSQAQPGSRVSSVTNIDYICLIISFTNYVIN